MFMSKSFLHFLIFIIAVLSISMLFAIFFNKLIPNDSKIIYKNMPKKEHYFLFGIISLVYFLYIVSISSIIVSLAYKTGDIISIAGIIAPTLFIEIFPYITELSFRKNQEKEKLKNIVKFHCILCFIMVTIIIVFAMLNYLYNLLF